MVKPHWVRHTIPLYLIPIMLGGSGLLFSLQFADPIARIVIVVLSVGAPLFTMGNAMARLHFSRGQRILMVGGSVLLLIGAVVPIWDMTAEAPPSFLFLGREDAPEMVRDVSRWLGIAGLLIGLAALLYIVVRREEELGKLAEHYGTLADRMGEGFLRTDAAGIVRVVNPSFLEMTGLPREQVVGQLLDRFCEDAALGRLLSEVPHRRAGDPAENTITWPSPTGDRHFWVSGSPLVDRKGRFQGALATFRDITELQELQQRLERYTQGLQKLVEDRTHMLRLSEERVRGLLLHMNEGFVTLDAGHRVHFANDRMREMLGVGDEGLYGRVMLDLLTPESRPVLMDLVAQAAAPQLERTQVELSLQRLDGAAVPVMAAIAPVEMSSEGEEEQYSLVLTDVTEYKRLQEQMALRAQELERVNAELRELDKAKDGFLTNVSHELRTPLSTVRGYAEMFADGSLGPLEPEQRKAVDVIHRNMQRLELLIQEMLDFSRMQIRGLQLDWRLCGVASLFAEAEGSLEPGLAKKAMEIVTRVPPDLPPAWCDRARVSQVLGILLSNAVKFSGEGDTVRLTAEARLPRTLVIHVADTGIGIDPAHQKRVFDKFFQVDSSMTRRYEGAGIGLSIAKSIAEAHGGAIELQSAPGKGSTFSLVLPDRLVYPPAGPPLGERERACLEGLHVIVIDDTPESRENLTAVLRLAGCTVAEKRSTFEGFRLAATHTPAVVLLPDTMADLPVREAAAVWSQQFAVQDAELLVHLDDDAAADLKMELDAAGAGWLRRPFSFEELVARLCGGAHAEYGESGISAEDA